MIAYVRGTVVEKSPSRVIVEAGGIGYEVVIPLSTFERLPREGGEAKLLTFHSVREDDETLFGFASEGEREMFAKLNSVGGVGPKMAIAILSGSSIGELSLAIVNGDAKRISSIKGVGKKTAEKICIELKDKVNALEALGVGGGGAEVSPSLRDAVMALAALGFSDETANKMISAVVSENPSENETESLVRRALAGKGGKK